MINYNSTNGPYCLLEERKRKMEKDFYKRLTKYYLIFTFVLTFGTGIILYLLGGLEESPILSGVITFFPAIVAIILTIIFQKWEGFSHLVKSLGLRLGKKRYMFIYPMFMFIIVIFTYFVTYLISPETFISISELPGVLSELSIGFGTMPVVLQVISIFVLNSVLGSIITLPVILGEEIGWRTFLYPKLEKLYRKPGLLIGGVIWGIWHAPMILMGHNYPSAPFFGIFTMILFSIPMGIILYYFYRKSGSIITVALCHGVLNQTASTVMIFVKENTFHPIFHGATGLIGIMVFVIIAFIMYRNWNEHQMEFAK